MKTSDLRIQAKAIISALAFIILLASRSAAPPPRPEVDIEPEKYSYQDGSLWPGTSKRNMFFSDNKASRVGDIVMVQIIEKTTAINKADTTDNHTVEDSLTLDTGAANPTQMKVGGGGKYTGRGQTGRSDQFSATVSCVVTEVLSNGNMNIDGQRRMKINDEDQYILVRGMVRPDDITYNNTIISSQMANADIVYTGGGGMDSGRRPGWLSRIFQSIWPF